VSTVGDQIFALMVAKANTSTPAGLPASEPNRTADVKLEEYASAKANLFYQVSDDENPEGNDKCSPLQLHSMVVGIRQIALGTKTTTPEQEADKIRAWNVKALSDQSFGGLATYCRPFHSEWVRSKEPIRQNQIELVSLWRVEFSSRAVDAELAA